LHYSCSLYKLLQHGWQEHDLGMHSHSWVGHVHGAGGF
jgi:hypothetical protein